jgi:hypothetical protein
MNWTGVLRGRRNAVNGEGRQKIERDAWRLGIEDARLKLGSSSIEEAEEEEEETLNFFTVCSNCQ